MLYAVWQTFDNLFEVVVAHVLEKLDGYVDVVLADEVVLLLWGEPIEVRRVVCWIRM